MTPSEDLRKSGVYGIQNSQNGKLYIGSSGNIFERLKAHLKRLRANKHHSRKLQNSWNKWGESAFTLSVLETCEPQDLINREQFWMDLKNPFYNICRTAGSPRGVKHTEQTRANMRAAQAKRSPATNQKVAEANTGKVRTAESIARYKSMYSRLNPDEQLASVRRMVEARKGVPVSTEGRGQISRKNSREFVVTDPSGVKRVITNLTALCNENGLDRACMTRVSTGVLKSHKGWVCINPRRSN